MAKTIWTPQPGPQTRMILSPADEILAGGARGGGKTLGGIMWLLKGNSSLPADHPAHATALNYPRYTALVVRRQSQDLRNWIDEAYEVFRDTGVTPRGNPVVFEWKTGPKIYTDHLNDENAFSKYRGWNLQRILIEELTEVPFEKWYLRLFGSMRRRQAQAEDQDKALYGAPAPQILATTNPDGPGHVWVKKRFVEVYGENGRIPPNTIMRDPISGMTRIFIPALLDDNKFLGQEYERMLLAQRGESEATYLAWRYGRWDVFSGQFFGEFRPDGPMPGTPPEPKEANHVFDLAEAKLAPWWPVAIGVDWGYNHEAAAYWGRWGQDDKRLYVYREMVVRQMGSRQLGQEIAKRTVQDLMGLEDNPHIPLFLSHDAFSKEDNTRTRAELFCDGIEDVLGPGSAHVAEFTDSEKKMAPQDAYASMESRYAALTNGPCITVHRARADRAAMAGYIRELLNWRPLERKEPDIEWARQLLTHPDGQLKYEEYMAKFQQKQEPLPKLKVERSCIKLKDCLTSLVFDPNNTEVPLKVDSTPTNSSGDDPYDALCYLAMGARLTLNRQPRHVFVGARLDKLRSIHGANPDPVLIGQVLERAHEDYNKSTPLEWLSFERMQ